MERYCYSNEMAPSRQNRERVCVCVCMNEDEEEHLTVCEAFLMVPFVSEIKDEVIVEHNLLSTFLCLARRLEQDLGWVRLSLHCFSLQACHVATNVNPPH